MVSWPSPTVYLKVSSPAPPVRMSSPPAPLMMLSNSLPMMVSLPAPPLTFRDVDQHVGADVDTFRVADLHMRIVRRHVAGIRQEVADRGSSERRLIKAVREEQRSTVMLLVADG